LAKYEPRIWRIDMHPYSSLSRAKHLPAKKPECWLAEHPHAFYSDVYGRFLFFNIILRSIEETQKHEKIMYEPT
jgi:hypothetical protein